MGSCTLLKQQKIHPSCSELLSDLGEAILNAIRRSEILTWLEVDTVCFVEFPFGDTDLALYNIYIVYISYQKTNFKYWH